MMTANGGVAGIGADELRDLVREVLADVVGSAVRRSQPAAAYPAAELTSTAPLPPAPPSSIPHGVAAGPAGMSVPRQTFGRQAGGGTQGSSPGRPAAAHGTGHHESSDNASRTVRISTDDDLHAFALRILKLADNPKLRRDLIGGRLRFRLAKAAAGDAAAGVSAVGLAAAGVAAAGVAAFGAAAAEHRIDKGAVTERTVVAAAKAGARLVLGPRAVLTPLAKDKARALGVPIERAPANTEKER